MSAATRKAEGAEARDDEEASFEAALAAIRAGERTYLQIGRVTASSAEYQDPAVFCEALSHSALTGSAFAGAEVRARFFAWRPTWRPAPSCCRSSPAPTFSRLAKRVSPGCMPSARWASIRTICTPRRCMIAATPASRPILTCTAGSAPTPSTSWRPSRAARCTSVVRRGSRYRSEPRVPVGRGNLELAGSAGHPSLDPRWQLPLLQPHALPEAHRAQPAKDERRDQPRASQLHRGRTDAARARGQAARAKSPTARATFPAPPAARA